MLITLRLLVWILLREDTIWHKNFSDSDITGFFAYTTADNVALSRLVFMIFILRLKHADDLLRAYAIHLSDKFLNNHQRLAETDI